VQDSAHTGAGRSHCVTAVASKVTGGQHELGGMSVLGLHAPLAEMALWLWGLWQTPCLGGLCWGGWRGLSRLWSGF